MRRSLALLAALSLALPAAAQGTRFIKQFSKGALPAGFTFGRDKTWTLASEFEPLNGDRYVLVGYPGYKFGADRRVPEAVCYPMLDTVSGTVAWTTMTPSAPYVTGSDPVYYDAGKGEGGYFVRGRKDDRNHFAHWDLASGTLDWSTELNEDSEQSRTRPIGVDPAGRYFYYFEERHSSRKLGNDVRGDQATIGRLDLTSHALDDWQYRFKLPGRTGSLVGSLNVVPSADYRLFVITEHSEPGTGKVSPAPMAFVVDAEKRAHFTLPIPMTPYGVAIDRQNRYLAIGSNYEAKVYRYDLKARKRDMVVASVPRLHRLVLSADNGRLYALGKGKQLDLFSWPALKLSKRMAAGALAPGQTWVDPEGMGVTPNGRFAVLHNTQAPWGFKDDKGFYLTTL